ncbi:MAG: ABC transporter permease [Proteobacteria bacterium]|nr:ABC transporter permease [Pseudomonadota bacterium]
MAALSLRISLTATACAFALGVPLGVLLAIRRFSGRSGLLLVANAFQGLPPVVVGLAVYLLLSRSGPLGTLGWLFTPRGMILAQFVLVLPIVVALVHRVTEGLWRDFGDLFIMDGAGYRSALRQLLVMAAPAFATVFLTAFGRAIAEVGAIMIVGGNIRGHTRTMTTTIALETSKGELALAIALGLILMAIVMAIAAISLFLGRRAERLR